MTGRGAPHQRAGAIPNKQEIAVRFQTLDLICEWYSNFLWTKSDCLFSASVGLRLPCHVGSRALQIKRPLDDSFSSSASPSETYILGWILPRGNRQ